ncbi:MAG: translation initiation factor IF-3 [Firmicutes bacterium]|nr:translation initiation factor IF-3 [Bacillota bacterium]
MSREHRVNHGVRSKEVRVVDAEGNQLGILPTREALRLAEERQQDLVEVAPQAKPPVCRIMDYGKYKYEQSKREKEAKKKQRIITVKEVKLRPNIEDHDFNVKTKNAVRFLKAGDKVKVTIMFRGREIVHPKNGQTLLTKVAEEIGDLATVEKRPKLEGKNMFMILAPNLANKEE